MLGPGSLSSCLSGHKREGLLQSHGGLLLPTGRVLSRFISSLMALEPPSARTPQPEGLSLSPGLLACLQDNFAPQPVEEKFPHSPCTKPLPLKRPKASFKRPSWVLVPPRQGAAPGNSARPIARDRRGNASELRPEDSAVKKSRARTGKSKCGHVEKSQASCITGGSVKWCSPCGKLWSYLKKLRVELLYDPALPRLGICPGVKAWYSQRYVHPMCTPCS